MKNEHTSKTLSTVILAVATFCWTAGAVEFWLHTAGHTEVADEIGRSHPITWPEIGKGSLLTSLISLPYAIISIGLLWGVAWPCSHLLGGYTKPSAAIVGLLIGAAGGCMLSYTVYAIIGGWGPPFLIPAICAGAVLVARAATAVPRP